ncbi:Fe-Mn family superoxide dismutase, partial [Candidatus Phytoplasma aurantifolia]|nr:Fe-Mn family superoxide dismutase [Candidatus Phytoplasma aurantifolia]
TNKALNLFGSGWVWWIVNNKNLSEIITTTNQDTTHNLGYPILAHLSFIRIVNDTLLNKGKDCAC